MLIFQNKSFEEYLMSIEYELKEIKTLLTLVLNRDFQVELAEQVALQTAKDESMKQLILQYIEKNGGDNDDR